MAQSSTPISHPLRGKWFFFYQKAGLQRGKYDLEEGDYITTVEELFAVFKALPNITIFHHSDSVMLSRDKQEPKYESFPNGYRVTLYARSKNQMDAIIPRVLGAVLGEAILHSFQDVPEPKPQCEVIRFTHKPHIVYRESSSVDIWFSENPYMERVEQYFKELIKRAVGVTLQLRPLSEVKEPSKPEKEKSEETKSTE